MQIAFQITEDDTAHVLKESGRDIQLTHSGQWMLDRSTDEFQRYHAFVSARMDQVARAAMNGADELDGQTDRAHAEIVAILCEAGLMAAVLSPTPKTADVA